jgi:hypothetical protein
LRTAEAVRLAGHWKVDLVGCIDLNEDSGVRSALVKLTGRVRKAWTIAGGGRALRTIAYGNSQHPEEQRSISESLRCNSERDVVVRLDRFHLDRTASSSAKGFSMSGNSPVFVNSFSKSRVERLLLPERLADRTG